MVQLDDARAASGDERVFRRDEKAVEQDESPDGDQLECQCHAPTLRKRKVGAQVLEGPSTGRARSIGDVPVVLAALGPSERNEAREMRQRLGNREPALDRR